MCLQKDFVHFIADAQEIRFTKKFVIIITCFQMQVQILEAFVSALCEVIHFCAAGFNQPIFGKQISELSYTTSNFKS